MVELRENLHDALEHYLEGLMQKGEPLPEPSMGLDGCSGNGNCGVVGGQAANGPGYAACTTDVPTLPGAMQALVDHLRIKQTPSS